MIPGYKLQGEIARGGMGVVFRGLDARGQVVAIKVAKKTGAADLARFEREAEVLADLSHPGIVSIHATGVVNGCPYLVMDLVEGPSLEQIVRQGGPLSERRAVEICLALAKALEEVHRQEILHRDVKPDNVLMRGEQPVLVDFGIAKDTQATGQELTRTGAFLGTPGYAPLEQALGRKNALGPHTDVYGLGATLYFLATGRAPFEASELRELLARMNVGADAPSSLRAKLSAEFDAVCLMCLAPAPADRYPTAAALAEDLELLLAGGRPSASKAGGLGLAPRRPRWALPAGGSILLFGLLSAVVALNRPPPASPSPGAAEAPTSSPEATPDFGEIERLLGRGRHLEALDRLDRLPEPPTKLVWSALLPALQPLARHGTTNGLKAGLLLLERPAARWARAAKDGAEGASRDALAKAIVESVVAEGAANRAAMQAPEPSAFARGEAALQVVLAVRADYEPTREEVGLFVDSAPLFAHRHDELRHRYLEVLLRFGELRASDPRVQSQIARLSRLYPPTSVSRFLPTLNRAIALNRAKTDTLRQLELDLCRVLYHSQVDERRLVEVSQRLLEGSKLSEGDTSELFCGLTEVYVDRGDYAAALVFVERAIRRSPSGAWESWRACLRWKLGQRAGGLASARRALSQLSYQDSASPLSSNALSTGAGRRACCVLWQGARDETPAAVRDEFARVADAVLKRNGWSDRSLGGLSLAVAWCELKLGSETRALAALEAAVRHFRATAKDSRLPDGDRLAGEQNAIAWTKLRARVRTNTKEVSRELERLLEAALQVDPHAWRGR